MHFSGCRKMPGNLISRGVYLNSSSGEVCNAIAKGISTALLKIAAANSNKTLSKK